MEIKTKNIHCENIEAQGKSYSVIDEDFNVPDAKQDMEVILRSRGNVVIDTVRAEEGKAYVTGQLEVMIMYQGTKLEVICENIDFSEKVNVDSIVAGNKLRCRAHIDDLSVKLIHSRKFNIKAVIALNVICENITDTSIGCDIDSLEEAVQIKKDMVNAATVKVLSNETLRLREDVALPQGKPDISRILWHEINVDEFEYRVIEDSVSIKGSLKSFVIYEANDENMDIYWFEMVTPFEERIPASGCSSEMVGCVSLKPRTMKLEPKADVDGELRLVSVEATIDIEIKGYEESEFEYLKDMYVPMKNCSMTTHKASLRQLLMKNISKNKITHKSKLTSASNILSVCSCSGQAQVKMSEIVKDGIEINGMIDVNYFYITDNDKWQWEVSRQTFPFMHTIECRDINSNTQYNIDCRLENMSCSMVSKDEVELKCTVVMDTICFDVSEVNAIDSFEALKMPDEEYLRIPGITGYIVKEGEELWDVAKNNHCTCDRIRTVNKLGNDRVMAGDRLLLVKCN